MLAEPVLERFEGFFFVTIMVPRTRVSEPVNADKEMRVSTVFSGVTAASSIISL